MKGKIREEVVEKNEHKMSEIENLEEDEDGKRMRMEKVPIELSTGWK